MKNRILIVILGMLCLIVNYNCQEETLSLEEQSSNTILKETSGQKQPPPYTAKIYSSRVLQELIANSSGLKERLKSFNLHNTSSRTLESYTYGFSIDTTHVQKIETATYNSYTFIVERNEVNNTVVENYMYNEFTDGSYKQYLITYPILNGNDDVTYDIDNATVILLNDTSLLQRGTPTTCILSADIYQFPVCSDNVCASGEHTYAQGSLCDYWGKNGQALPGETCTEGGWITEEFGCTGSSGGSNNNPPTTDPGFEGGSIPDEPEDEIIVPLTNPFTMKLVIEDCLASTNPNFVPGTVANVNYGIATTTAMYNYLITENNCSSEAINFMSLAIEALEDNDGDGQPDGEVDFGNKVILDSSFVNDPRLKCAYDKLTADNNPLFRNTVGSFIDNPKFNLTFKKGNCTSTDEQCANTTDPYNITITFESVYAPIVNANAILHEAIHAELARYVALHQDEVDTDDYPRLFELYDFYRGQNVSEDNLDHPYMVLYFINPMADALRQFDDYSYPRNYYKSFAWDGLRKWDVNTVLGNGVGDTYSQYRPIVMNNTTVCND